MNEKDTVPPSRELSRTLVRVTRVKPLHFYVIVPGWNPRQRVRVPFGGLPLQIRPLITAGKRLHARVNVGCEEAGDLVFANWEPE